MLQFVVGCPLWTDPAIVLPSACFNETLWTSGCMSRPSLNLNDEIELAFDRWAVIFTFY